MTFRDLLADALIEIGVLAIGETPTADDLSSGLRRFNRMIGNWSTQNLLIYAQTEETFPFVANKGTYLMGPGGDFDTSKPKKIDGVSVIVSGTECPVDILTEDEWQLVQLKSTTSQRPCKVYPVATNPQYSLTFWPVPFDTSCSAKIYSLKPLSQITDVGVDYVMPPGYDMALLYDFAVLLCGSYGRPVSPDLSAIAMKAVADIKRSNIKPKLLATDPALTRRRRYNIFSGS